MRVLKLEEDNIRACAEEAAKVLRNGGLVVYPTDTVYGIAADAFSDIAVEKIYSCKGREENKPIHVVVENMSEAAKYANIPPAAGKLALAFLPGPLTLVLPYRGTDRVGIARRMDTIGIRMPKNDFCSALAKEFGRPYTTTSANRSGEQTKCRVKDILEQFDDAAAYFDLVIDGGELPECKPSTVVDLSSEKPIILREGIIDASKVWNALRT